MSDFLIKTGPPDPGICQVFLRCHLDTGFTEPSCPTTSSTSSTAQLEQSRCSFIKWYQNMVRKRLKDPEIKCAQGKKTYHVNMDILVFRSCKLLCATHPLPQVM